MKLVPKIMLTLFLGITLFNIASVKAELPRNIDPLYQPHGFQRMELHLRIDGKAGVINVEGPFYYRRVDDGDALWHAVLVIDSIDGDSDTNYLRAAEGDELLCHWKLLDTGYWGWIINSKDFNLHLYPTGERYQVAEETGERWRYTQPLQGKSYGGTVTGVLYQIGV